MRRARPKEIVDTKAGYIYDRSRQNPPNPVVGFAASDPGKAQVLAYPGCKDGRIVADVVRIDKGHTEGLEPNVTEELVKLMLSAKGGKLQQSALIRDRGRHEEDRHAHASPAVVSLQLPARCGSRAAR